MAKPQEIQAGAHSALPARTPSAAQLEMTPELCDLIQANHCHTPCIDQSAKPAFSDLELRLLNAGITPEFLMKQWGIILWSIRPKSDRIKIKVQANRPIQLHELERWFASILGQAVSVSQKPFSECCHSPCKGCLWASPEKRAFWNPLPITENPSP